MSTLQVDIPDSLYEQVETLARKEGVGMAQFIALALTEKVATLETVQYLTERARRGSREKFLAKAPDVEPEEADRL